MLRHKSKAGDEKLIYDESADSIERVAAISRLAVDGYYDMEPLLAEMLHHSSYHLRAEAIKTLVGLWKKAQYIDEAIQILHTDPDWEPRSDAAYALANYAKRTSQQEQRIIGELSSCLVRDGKRGVQEECYRGVLQLLAPERRTIDESKRFDRERDVDWELLKPYLDESQMPQTQATR